MISAYSFVMALIFFNMAMIIAYVLRRKRDFVAKYGIQTVITIVVFGLLRLLLPVGIEEAYVIGSTKFVPAVQTALNYGIAGTDFSLGEALLALWALGAIVFIAKDIVTIVCFKRERAKYGHCECAAVFEAADELKINNKITVTPDAPVPYVAGYLKQEIFLPSFCAFFRFFPISENFLELFFSLNQLKFSQKIFVYRNGGVCI